MHWRQREMLFEQKEALKEQASGTKKRKKDRDDDERLSKKDTRRKFGRDAVIKMAPPLGKQPSIKSEKRNARTTNIQAIGSKQVGQRPSDKRLKTSRSKKESHCEAYAEAYVRGVEQALSEKRKVTKDRRLRTQRGVVPTTKVREGHISEVPGATGGPGPRPFKPRGRIRLQSRGPSVKPTTRANAPKPPR